MGIDERSTNRSSRVQTQICCCLLGKAVSQWAPRGGRWAAWTTKQNKCLNNEGRTHTKILELCVIFKTHYITYIIVYNVVLFGVITRAATIPKSLHIFVWWGILSFPNTVLECLTTLMSTAAGDKQLTLMDTSLRSSLCTNVGDCSSCMQHATQTIRLEFAGLTEQQHKSVDICVTFMDFQNCYTHNNVIFLWPILEKLFSRRSSNPMLVQKLGSHPCGGQNVHLHTRVHKDLQRNAE